MTARRQLTSEMGQAITAELSAFAGVQTVVAWGRGFGFGFYRGEAGLDPNAESEIELHTG